MDANIIAPKDIADMAGLTVTRINQLRKSDPAFPPPVNPGHLRPRWHRDDIVTWLERTGRKPEGDTVRAALQEWESARGWGNDSALTATGPGPILAYTNKAGDVVCVNYRIEGGLSTLRQFCREHRATWAISVSPQLNASGSHLCSVAHMSTNYGHPVVTDMALSAIAQHLSLDLAYYPPYTPAETILAAPTSVVTFPSTCTPFIAPDLPLLAALPSPLKEVVLYDLAQVEMRCKEPGSKSHMFNPFPEPSGEDRERADAMGRALQCEPITDASIFHLFSRVSSQIGNLTYGLGDCAYPKAAGAGTMFMKTWKKQANRTYMWGAFSGPNGFPDEVYRHPATDEWAARIGDKLVVERARDTTHHPAAIAFFEDDWAVFLSSDNVPYLPRHDIYDCDNDFQTETRLRLALGLDLPDHQAPSELRDRLAARDLPWGKPIPTNEIINMLNHHKGGGGN